jgi:hypothetical protein
MASRSRWNIVRLGMSRYLSGHVGDGCLFQTC